MSVSSIIAHISRSRVWDADVLPLHEPALMCTAPPPTHVHIFKFTNLYNTKQKPEIVTQSLGGGLTCWQEWESSLWYPLIAIGIDAQGIMLVNIGDILCRIKTDPPVLFTIECSWKENINVHKYCKLKGFRQYGRASEGFLWSISNIKKGEHDWGQERVKAPKCSVLWNLMSCESLSELPSLLHTAVMKDHP